MAQVPNLGAGASNSPVAMHPVEVLARPITSTRIRKFAKNPTGTAESEILLDEDGMAHHRKAELLTIAATASAGRA